MFKRPNLENPVLIAGLTGFGAVGRLSADLLIESSKAELLAELYSPYLPDYVIIDEEGIIRLPNYRFYYSKRLERDVMILTCDTQPPGDDLKAHYVMCSLALDFAEEHGCRFVVTMGGFPNPKSGKELFIAATDVGLAKRFVDEKVGIYRNGRIIGGTGLLLGLAKLRGIEGVSVLGVTAGLMEDHKAAFSVFKFVSRLLGEL